MSGIRHAEQLNPAPIPKTAAPDGTRRPRAGFIHVGYPSLSLQVTMKLSDLMWKIARTALFAFAVLFVWSPFDAGAASPYDQGVQSSPQIHQTHAAQNGQDGTSQVSHYACCDAPSVGCCVMMLCHPALSVDAHRLPIVAADDATAAATELLGLGSDPEVILPPPRSVLV